LSSGEVVLEDGGDGELVFGLGQDVEGEADSGADDHREEDLVVEFELHLGPIVGIGG